LNLKIITEHDAISTS